MAPANGHGARLGTLLCVHDEHYFLSEVLGHIVPGIERLVFSSRHAWHGTAGESQRTASVAKEAGARVIEGDWDGEDSHRRAALAALRDEGFSHALIVDADEVYEPGLLDSLIRIAEADLADRVRCFMDTYWQDPMHVVRPREALAPIALVKLDAVQHVHIRDFQGGRELVLGPEHGVIHHLSYAGPDQRVKRKIETWSHRDELVSCWWQRSWQGWKADPTLRDLHPTHPRAYGFIERIPCPEILHGAFGAAEPLRRAKPARSPKISVVVPVYGEAEKLRLCLTSLAGCADLLYEVVVVDDASPDSALEVAKGFAAEFPTEPHGKANGGSVKMRVLENEANLGFAATSNLGARVCSGDVVLFLNSDTIVPRSGLIGLVETLTSSGSVAAAGPMTNNAGYYQRLDPTYTDLDRIELFANDLANSQREDRDVDMLVGFCLAVRKSVLDEVGLFDERFGRGLFEDTDLCYRIARAGYRLRLSSKAYVHHWGSQSMGQAVDMPALLNANEKVYREKWARDLETGFASHLPGLAINETPVQFNQDRSPEKLDKELAAKVAEADISLCMIVRDEERVLADCLRSAKPFFTQIIVIDTGSTDRTIEIAKEHGAEVYEMEWKDSFSVARNESLKYARGKWIFWMDADDTMPRRTGDALVATATTAPKELVGFIVPVQFREDGEGAGTRVDHVKLFRNIPGLAFEGRIHEQILAPLRAHGDVARIDAIVNHSGYDTSPEGQKKKRERDWKLLRLEFAERGNHPFVLFCIGMTHHFCKNHKKAVRWLRRCIRHSESTASHLRKTYAMLGSSLSQLGQAELALDVLSEGDRAVQGDPELQFLRAKLLSEIGRLQEAIKAYETMMTSIDEFLSSVDIGILTYKRLHNLAAICIELGDYVSARKHLRSAIEANPNFVISALALFDSAMNHGDLRTADEALRAIYRITGPSLEWAERGEALQGSLGGDAAVEGFLFGACRRHPKSPGAAMVLARRLCRTGREEQALPMLRGLTEAKYAEAAYYLGIYELRRENTQEALRWMRLSLELNPANSQVLEQIEQLGRAIGQG